MADEKQLLKSIYEKNEKIIESVVSGKYADVDYYAHEIKSEIDRHNRSEGIIAGESQEDMLSKILNMAPDVITPDSPSDKLLGKKNSGDNKSVSEDKKEIKTNANIITSYDVDDMVNVLIVDDNELNLEVEEKLLKKEGFHVMMANSARRAITLFANSSENDIQIILTDISMPGMDGNEMTKEIRTLDHPAAKTVMIIAISADKSDAAVKTSFNAGMNGYINKPFDISQFKRIIAGARRR